MKNLLLHPTPIGTVGIVENGRAITDILFEEQLPGDAVQHTTPLLEQAAKQLDEYFTGKRTSFDLPLEPEGTPYRKKVWQVLTEIPYGQTMTYGEIARRTGNPQASRAVGGANHHNPIPIVIPCHRVIGAGGKLTGYAGGLPLEPEGTPYRKKVWQVLTEIPYGQTMTYGEIARRTGNPQASRAVGGANHHNPIPIVIPCHRVIGAGGKLTGYAGGLPRKEFLLALERNRLPK